jgi:Ser/Thr protein kinase RdoA (MazF antagonist)
VTENETALAGGRWTAGVVRVGDTVRRRAVDFTGRLLTSLAAHGFDGCPRYLGRDEAGRDVLSFVAGDVPPRWGHFEDAAVTAAARLLRGMHDASRELAAEIGGGAVICHHDAAPNNAIFRDGRPVAFFDFDFAAPGDPIEDVAYAAWSWCLSSRPDRGYPQAQAAQVARLAGAYGLTRAQCHALPAAIESRILHNEAFWRAVEHHGRTEAERETPPAPAEDDPTRALASTAESRPRAAEASDPGSDAALGPVSPVEAQLIREAGPEAVGRAAEMAEWSRREAAFVGIHQAVLAEALGEGCE